MEVPEHSTHARFVFVLKCNANFPLSYFEKGKRGEGKGEGGVESCLAFPLSPSFYPHLPTNTPPCRFLTQIQEVYNDSLVIKK
jgi:hypothetical protein